MCMPRCIGCFMFQHIDPRRSRVRVKVWFLSAQQVHFALFSHGPQGSPCIRGGDQPALFARSAWPVAWLEPCNQYTANTSITSQTLRKPRAGLCFAVPDHHPGHLELHHVYRDVRLQGLALSLSPNLLALSLSPNLLALSLSPNLDPNPRSQP